MTLNDLKLPNWSHGQLMAFSALDGLTSYDFGLCARTVVSPHGLEICEPGKCRIYFVAESDSTVISAGDFFQFGESRDSVCGAFVDAHHLLIEGPIEIAAPDERIRIQREGNRTLVGAATHFRLGHLALDMKTVIAERSHWILSQQVPPSLSPSSKTAYFRALCIMKGQVCSPETSIRHRWTTPDRWPHKDMWLWDTGFHAIGWRHIAPGLAMEMIEAMLDLQRTDGFLTYRGSVHGPSSHLGDLMTQPPILAYVALLVFERTGDLEWLGRIYPKLAGYIRWDFAHRDSDGAGLVEWFIEDDPDCRSGESGMDNSPRFDSARKNDAVDFNSFLAAECSAMADAARHLGRISDIEEWEAAYEKQTKLINERMWHAGEGFYCDSDPATGKPAPILSSAGFLPLFAGGVPAENARRLAHALLDPQMFGTPVPVPSIAAKDTTHYEKDMWRGPVWINLNWLIASGLDRQGFHSEAKSLRQATVAEIERCFERFGTFFEFYDDRREVEPPQLLRKKENAPEKNPYRQVIHDFGWSVTLYVDLIHELHSPTMKETGLLRDDSCLVRTD